MTRSGPSTSFLSILTVLLTLIIASTVLAYPHYGELWELKQPDGAMVTVKVWGDEYYQVVESLDGYTLVRDDVTGIICYARLSADGNAFESTGVRAGSASPAALGVTPHLRLTREARRAIAMEKRREQYEGARMALASRGWDIDLASPPKVGNVKGLTLLVDFSDQVATIPAADIDDYCNQIGYTGNGNNGSVRDYFFDVSNGNLIYTNWVMPSYHRASQPFSYYDDCSVPWLQRAKELIFEILNQLETDGHDFSQYDSNGDGYIDAINLFYAGSTTCGWSEAMWPGSGWFQDAWSADGVATLKYQITGMGAGLNISTFCHENGHMICWWPDLYDYDDDPDNSQGVGKFCLMCNAADGNNPVEPCAYLKIDAGWATVTTLSSDAFGLLMPVSSTNQFYKINHLIKDNEYYLVSNRQKTGRDQFVPDAGLAIWHIDENGNNSNNQMTSLLHYLVTLEQADGLWEMENNINSGDGDDLYSSPDYTAWGICTYPGSEWWDGMSSGVNITNISASATTMTFDFTSGSDPPVAVCQSYSADADESCCIEVGVSDIDDGSYDPQGEGDIVSMLITAVDGSPVTPAETVTVCGDGMHTVTLTVTDLCDNTDACDADVEVVNSPPVTVCRSYSAEADTACCIVVHKEDIDDGSYDPDGSGDIKSFGITAIDGVPMEPADSVEICGNGFYSVTLTMTDWCDSTSSCDAEVEVIDVTPPTIVVTLNRYDLWPPNHKMADITATVEVEDNCDADPDWVLQSIESDEPDNGKADGNTVGDIAEADTGTTDVEFMLRSERMGKEDGRVYTIIYRAWDESNNVAWDTVTVEVPHDQGYHAMAAHGFGADGTALADGARAFIVVIPSCEAVYDTQGKREILVTPAVVAPGIDPSLAYVGNTAGAVRPDRTLVLDANADGLDDLALVYDARSAARLRAVTEALTDDEIAAGVIYDGPLGLHFRGQDGTPWLVEDIFALGAPIALHEQREEPKFDDSGPAVSSDANVEYDNGIASIHPNPFNPSTTVRFTLASAGDVTLAIYDVRGALVRVLVDRNLPGGEHNVGWDGTDSQGRTVATGVYFARMVTGQFEMTRKMVLVK